MKRICVSLAFFLVLCNFSALGQSAPFLSLWPDAVTLAMGGTGTVANQGAFSLYNNSAATVLSNQKGALGASYSLWQTGEKNHYATLSGFAALGSKSAISVGFRGFSHPLTYFSGPEGVVTGSYQPLECSIDMGFAYKILGDLSAGATLHYVRSQMGAEHTGNAFAADLGLLYSPGTFRLGLTAKNLGTKMDYGTGPFSLPARIELGAGICIDPAPKHSLHAALQGGYLPVTGGFTAGIGLEYTYNQWAALRLGTHYGDPQKDIPSFVSAGFGFSFFGISLQGVWLMGLQNAPLTNSFMVSLEWAF